MKWVLPLLLLLFVRAHALYTANPFAPEVIQKGWFMSPDSLCIIKLGYQGDLVLDRKMRAYSGATGRVDTFALLANQGVVTIDYNNRLEAFGSMGALQANITKCQIKQDHKVREFQTHDQFTWGVGARFVLLRFEHTDVGIAGTFQYAHPHIACESVRGEGFGGRGKLRYREWQLSAGLSHQIDIFYPYLALKYSNAHAFLHGLSHHLEMTPTSFKMSNRDHIGLALGCTLSNTDLFDTTFEIRMIDEQAMTLAGTISF